MRRVISWLGYGFFGFFILGLLLPEEDSAERTLNASSTPKAVLQPVIPNTPEKTELFATLPQNASLTTETPKVSNPAKLTQPKVTSEPQFVYVTAPRVNIRSGPSTNFKILGTHVVRNKLVLLDTDKGWSHVSGNLDGTPVVGWMSSKYLSETIPERKPQTKSKPRRTVAVPAQRNISAARKAIIRQSIASYPGSCPCDYNRDRAGRRCGKRSAWSRRGGYAPLCYESDVTQAHLQSYFARNR